MIANPLIMNSVEDLNYRVTVGDVAASAGLELNVTQQGLLALASNAGGHLQVADSGEIVFLFPRNFRTILRNKFLRLRLQEWGQKIWRVIFYLIRISFGILLLISILIMMIAIAIIIIGLSSSRDGNNNSGSRRSSPGGGFFFFPRFLFSPDIFWLFHFNRYQPRTYQQKTVSASQSSEQMNFLEAVFSFLFGDGDPNANLEGRRWQAIGSTIRHQGGAVAGEQILPYLDQLSPSSVEDEEYVLPVLSRFNGYPQVTPQGQIIYSFPELQVTATEQKKSSISSYLEEQTWKFSQASSGQILMAIALGCANFILALVLGSLLQGDTAAQFGSFIVFVDSIYWLLLGYGTAFLSIPLLRYFWIQGKNKGITARNQERQQRALALNELDEQLKEKMLYARQFSAQKVITEEDLTYSTETDLLEQNLNKKDKIDHLTRLRLRLFVDVPDSLL